MAFEGIFLGAHQGKIAKLQFPRDSFQTGLKSIGPSARTVVDDPARPVHVGIVRAASQFLSQKQIGDTTVFEQLLKTGLAELRKPAAVRSAADINKQPHPCLLKEPGKLWATVKRVFIRLPKTKWLVASGEWLATS
jgi:hypothetical protein